MKYILTFESVYFVMKAGRILKREEIDVTIIRIPRKISSDCGMALEVRCNDIERIKTVLGNHKCDMDAIYKAENY